MSPEWNCPYENFRYADMAAAFQGIRDAEHRGKTFSTQDVKEALANLTTEQFMVEFGTISVTKTDIGKTPTGIPIYYPLGEPTFQEIRIKTGQGTATLEGFAQIKYFTDLEIQETLALQTSQYLSMVSVSLRISQRGQPIFFSSPGEVWSATSPDDSTFTTEYSLWKPAKRGVTEPGIVALPLNLPVLKCLAFLEKPQNPQELESSKTTEVL